jgi:DNA primase
MKVWQAGIPGVVALWGTTLHPAQRALVVQAPKVVLALDGDPAGRDAAARIAADLAPTPVEVAALPDGQDPDDLGDQELRSLLAPPSPSSPCRSSP